MTVLAVREDVPLEGGGTLRAGQLVKIWGENSGDYVGIEWRDGEGSHVMAISRKKLGTA